MTTSFRNFMSCHFIVITNTTHLTPTLCLENCCKLKSGNRQSVFHGNSKAAVLSAAACSAAVERPPKLRLHRSTIHERKWHRKISFQKSVKQPKLFWFGFSIWFHWGSVSWVRGKFVAVSISYSIAESLSSVNWMCCMNVNQQTDMTNRQRQETDIWNIIHLHTWLTCTCIL